MFPQSHVPALRHRGGLPCRTVLGAIASYAEQLLGGGGFLDVFDVLLRYKLHPHVCH